MKTKYFTAIILAAVLLSGVENAYAQERVIEKYIRVDSTGKIDTVETVKLITSKDITPIKSMITINPLKFFLFYNINFYTKVSNFLVLGGGLQTPTIKNLEGFGINLEMRYHPKENAMRGFYLAPNFSFNQLRDKDSKWGTAYSLGLLLGWQWFPSESFAIGLGIGVDRYFFPDDKDVDGFAPALRFDVGFAW